MISMASRSLGGSTLTAWKRRSSDRSFSMYFRYSAGVVAPMQRISPRESAGFRMLAASSGPLAGAARGLPLPALLGQGLAGVVDEPFRRPRAEPVVARAVDREDRAGEVIAG